MADETTAPVEETTADPMARIAAALEEANRRDAELENTVAEKVREAVAALDKEPQTRQTAGATDRVVDPYTREGYTRSDFELAMMVQEGAKRLTGGPVDVRLPEEFLNAARWHIFEDPKTERIRVSQSNGNTRAMDTAETGYGLEIIGAQYVRDLWEAARNMDSIVSDIRTIPMSDPTTYVPIDGDLPEMLFVGESTADSATAYSVSDTASNRVTLSAKKFTIQQIWSGELDEDSIIPFVPFLRDKLNMAAALYLGSSYYNGDTTNAGTGNINSDDADPADTKHYLAYDGIRHYWLVDATGQGVNQAGALDPKNLNVVRGRLNGGDDDVDNLVKNINWGTNPRELRAVMDWDTYMALLDGDKVVTVDKYGPGATIVTGELGSIYGIPIISPSYASKTEADGKASGTEASNTLGQITVYNPRGFLAGRRREVQLFFDRIQRTDQFLFELYTRTAFTRFGGNVAGGIYNISL